jgi:hypothetical protein
MDRKSILRMRKKMWALGWSMAGGEASKAPWTCASWMFSCSCLPPFFKVFCLNVIGLCAY